MQTVRNINRQKKINLKKQARNYGKVWLQRGRPYTVVAIAIINDEFGEPVIEDRVVFNRSIKPHHW